MHSRIILTIGPCNSSTCDWPLQSLQMAAWYIMTTWGFVTTNQINNAAYIAKQIHVAKAVQQIGPCNCHGILTARKTHPVFPYKTKTCWKGILIVLVRRIGPNGDGIPTSWPLKHFHHQPMTLSLRLALATVDKLATANATTICESLGSAWSSGVLGLGA